VSIGRGYSLLVTFFFFLSTTAWRWEVLFQPDSGEGLYSGRSVEWGSRTFLDGMGPDRIPGAEIVISLSHIDLIGGTCRRNRIAQLQVFPEVVSGWKQMFRFHHTNN